MRFCNLHGVLRLFDIRACYHELLAAHIESSLQDVIEVVRMSLSPVIYACKHGISEVDSNLSPVRLYGLDVEWLLRTNINVSQVWRLGHGGKVASNGPTGRI